MSFELRPYQTEIANKGNAILKNLGIVYLAMEVRTGKTTTALEIANLFGAQKVLFITKLKAIQSIKNDYKNFGYTFDLTIVNNESLHTINDAFDLLISDENHRLGTFPKPNKVTQLIKKRYSNLPMIFLSGTPHAESYSQIFNQFWVSAKSPFNHYPNFYKWAHDFVNVKERYFGYAKIKDYSDADYNKIKPFIDKYFIKFTQKDAGFTSEVNENVLYCEMEKWTYKIAETIKRDKVFIGNNDTILADTGAKEMQKLHQIYSGTCILESGKTIILDKSKGEFIKDKFAGEKIAIFYKFKAEYDLLKEVFRNNLTDNLEDFNSSDKNIALQIVSGREGISLSKAKYLVYFNIDFSALSYWQSRARLTTIERLKNDVFWIFAKNGIEDKIYKTVLNKKNYTLKIYINEK